MDKDLRLKNNAADVWRQHGIEIFNTRSWSQKKREVLTNPVD